MQSCRACALRKMHAMLQGRNAAARIRRRSAAAARVSQVWRRICRGQQGSCCPNPSLPSVTCITTPPPIGELAGARPHST